MIISVKVKLKVRQEKIEKISKNVFKISINQVTEKQKANKAIIKILADYFNLPISRIKIVSGIKSKEKILEIKI